MLLEVRMDHWRSLLSATALSDESSQAMSIANARWLFDGARDVVVGVAQLVGQQLDLIRGLLHVVVDDLKLRGRAHSLLRSHRHEIELIRILVCDGGVNDGASIGVLEVADRAVENTSVDALAADEVHELGRVGASNRVEGSLDLLDLGHADARLLAFTNTVAIEDDLLGVAAIATLEAFESSAHASLQRGGGFLTDFVLCNTRRPIGGGMLVH